MKANMLSVLFLAGNANVGLAVGLSIGIVVALGIGFLVGFLINRKLTEKRLGEVQTRTKKMIDDASLECKALKKEAILDSFFCPLAFSSLRYFK